MTGILLFIVFICCIALMILMIARFKVHPFLALLTISLVLAFAGGIGLRDITSIIGNGFATMFGGIGIVILFGMLIGNLLEKTGAALKMADCAIRLVGKRHPELALLLVGWIVSIPVFCDSGFVILNPIRKQLSARTRYSSIACTIALASGLLISHCLIPPTPGPMAAASALYGSDALKLDANLLMVMGVGALCSIFPAVIIYFFVQHIGKKPEFAKPEETGTELFTEVEQNMPGAFLSFAPIVLPVLLMGLTSALVAMGKCPDILYFLGQPMMSLGVGLLLALFVLWRSPLKDKLTLLQQVTDDTLKTGGPILFITAAGGVLGAVIKNTDLINFIAANAHTLQPLGYAFPFLIAVLLKCAQGSSTVAMTTTAGIVAPLMSTLGWTTPMSAALLTIAIGGGSMVVSHANDSFFWVITGFGGMDVKTGYRTYTVATLLCGISVLIGVLIFSMILH